MGASQGVSHIAQKEKFAGRYASGMRRYAPFANIDFSFGKEIAQMVISPSVAKPKLEHIAFQALHQLSPQIEARTLRLQSADKAVEPAHQGSGVDASLLAQSPDFVKGGAQLIVRGAQLIVRRRDA